MNGNRPPLRIVEVGGRIRLGVEGFAYVEGVTLSDAADALVSYMLGVAMAFRSGGVGPVYSGWSPDAYLLEFVWALGEHVAAGGDPREFLFGDADSSA